MGAHRSTCECCGFGTEYLLFEKKMSRSCSQWPNFRSFWRLCTIGLWGNTTLSITCLSWILKWSILCESRARDWYILYKKIIARKVSMPIPTNMNGTLHTSFNHLFWTVGCYHSFMDTHTKTITWHCKNAQHQFYAQKLYASRWTIR